MCYNWRMNPSNDNYFGSSGTGGTPYGGVSGASGVSGGETSGPSGVGGFGGGVGFGGADNTVGIGSVGNAVGAGSGGVGGGAGGMFPSNQMQLISSGGGDVVLAPEPQNKTSKKGLVIGAIVVALLLAVGLVVMVVTSRSGSGGGRELTARERFNMLLNYVISGEESTADVTEEYSSDAKYYFNEQQKTMANREALYAKTSELLDNFMKAYDELGDKGSFSSDEGEFERTMKIEKGRIDFIELALIEPVIINSKMLEEYNTYGRKKAVDSLLVRYNNASVIDNNYAKRFLVIFQNYVDSAMNIFELFDRNGCIINGSLNYECMQSKEDNSLAKYFAEQKQRNKVAYITLNSYYDLREDFLEDIFKMNDLVTRKGSA